ncbi:MAG: hypothetical protein IPO33_20035 [Saprospiraceae bacterium]|nr:hypothetical protein [Candidatus Brachybacter algidus]
MKVAAENGLDIRDLKARQFQTKDFDDFDIIYVMAATGWPAIIHNSKRSF